MVRSKALLFVMEQKAALFGKNKKDRKNTIEVQVNLWYNPNIIKREEVNP